MNRAFAQNDPDDFALATSVSAPAARAYDAPRLVVLGRAAAITQGSASGDYDPSGLGRRP